MINTKNKVFIITFISLIFSIFIFCFVFNNNIKCVYADNSLTNFSFVGSNIITPSTSLGNNGSSFDTNSFIDVSCSFSFVDGQYNASVSGHFMSSTLNRGYDFYDNYEALPLGHSSSDFVNLYPVITSGYCINIMIVRVGNITSDINRVVFTSTEDAGNYYNHVYYYDIYDNYIRFSFPVWNNYSFYRNFMFDTRTYYINLNFTDNTYYQAGYDDGYNQGIYDGNESGYEDGYNAGNTIGYEDGYNDGVANSNSYSFASLLGAVIDTPVSAFTSLLNFEILGVNILAFVSGLLTLAIVIFIVKLCLGGR